MDGFIEARDILTRFEIEFDGSGTMPTRFFNEARRRINMTGSSDRQKKIGLSQRPIDTIHLQRHFAEPDDVRPQRR